MSDSFSQEMTNQHVKEQIEREREETSMSSTLEQFRSPSELFQTKIQIATSTEVGVIYGRPSKIEDRISNTSPVRAH